MRKKGKRKMADNKLTLICICGYEEEVEGLAGWDFVIHGKLCPKCGRPLSAK